MQPTSPPPQTPGQRPSLDEYDSDSQSQPPRRSPRHPRALQSPGEPAPNYSRPAMAHAQSQTSLIDRHLGHRPRQRSQGYFEPSLSSMRPDALASPPPLLSASQLAAQAAYQQSAHMRKRSTTIPAPADPAPARATPQSPPPLPMTFRTNGMTYTQGLPRAAASAATQAFPTSPLMSPGYADPPPASVQASPRLAAATPELVLQKAPKEKSKMKLFSSKPKTDEKPLDKKHQPLPSPGKIGIGIHSSHALNRVMNPSTTSLLESPATSSAASLYSSANVSTSTLVPKSEKEKHKHHFLSRTKAKLKDKDDHALPLSSVNSTSRPTNPNAPESLYNFAPSSPLPGSSFPSSVTGLDLRHAGRGLREAKKNAKAAAYLGDNLDPSYTQRPSFSTDRSEWPSLASSLSNTPGASASGTSIPHTAEMLNLGSSFGINGLSPDDAWPLLKARVLQIFEGEDPRPPVEDFNALVSVHVKRCIQKRSPILLIEDLNELLATGFSSLDQTLRHIPDERLIPPLVEIWLVVFTSILPFLQAVFLPLDLEFRGTGIMSSTQASEFWGVVLPDEMSSRSPTHKNVPLLGELDVRRITLLAFRDAVILPRYDALMAVFSRLALDTLNPGPDPPAHDALPARSRATSAASAGSFTPSSASAPAHAHASAPAAMDSAKVTETVGRMLQCVSVLVSLQSGDERQERSVRLGKELKYNWLGRGRTGRQRQGFVGPRRGGGLPVGGLAGLGLGDVLVEGGVA
ncbi:HbrB-like-domain-containing protein [Boeremia exigua]|uniref:HbrB-like-domain-containing protein n=1 Tax=Boeremia exigua TaxID=749465 RepID=UPI001E8E9573|nr:HbrB-like-domain-containing protein [Boeremia exigua]KAH6618601.1 HbrB-like-domain-containing protein [Boeremia exigua]